jgi:hypothetical protein
MIGIVYDRFGDEIALDFVIVGIRVSTKKRSIPNL